jgi:hypothetical protein
MTSLGYDEGLLYPHHLDCWQELAVPPGHGLMVSFREFDLLTKFDSVDCLDLHVTSGDGNVSHALHECGVLQLAARVFASVTKVTVNHTMEFYDAQFGVGFKMLFSFHVLDRLPQRVSDGQWNWDKDFRVRMRRPKYLELVTLTSFG